LLERNINRRAYPSPSLPCASLAEARRAAISYFSVPVPPRPPRSPWQLAIFMPSFAAPPFDQLIKIKVAGD
jgi:hypothetical protein